MEKPFVRSAYNYDMDEASVESGLTCPEPSLAKQEYAEESDINTIVEQFGLTGQLPQGLEAPTFGDFTGVDDYQSALNAIMEAEAAFMEMPANVRSRFENNPQLFVEFCSDEANREEATKLGLVFKNEVDQLINPSIDPKNPPLAEQA